MTAIIKTISFDFEGKTYDLRVSHGSGRYEVRAYLNETPANGYSYSVDEITGMDWMRMSGVTGIDHLIAMAKSDIENRVWEQYVEAINEIKNQGG